VSPGEGAISEPEAKLPLEIVLANCSRDGIISAHTAEAKVGNAQLLALVAEGPRLQQEGRALELIQKLWPHCVRREGSPLESRDHSLISDR